MISKIAIMYYAKMFGQFCPSLICQNSQIYWEYIDYCSFKFRSLDIYRESKAFQISVVGRVSLSLPNPAYDWLP